MVLVSLSIIVTVVVSSKWRPAPDARELARARFVQ